MVFANSHCVNTQSVKVLFAQFVQLFATPWTIACQAPLSMEFSRQEYWSAFLFPSPGHLLDPGLNSGLLHCRQTIYHLSQYTSANVKLQSPALGRDPHNRVGRVSGLQRSGWTTCTPGAQKSGQKLPERCRVSVPWEEATAVSPSSVANSTQQDSSSRVFD